MKRQYKIILIIIISVVLVFIGVKTFSNYVEKKITSSINKSNSNVHIANVDFKLFDRSLTLKNVFFSSRSSNDLDSISQIIKNDSLEKITITSIKISGIHYLDFIRDKYIKIGKVEFNDVFINKTNKKSVSKSKDKPMDLDSIYIEKINGFEIDRFDFNNVRYTVVDSLTHKIVFQHKPASFGLNGFQLKKVKDQIFKIELIDEVFKINDIILNVANENYKLSIKEVNLDTKSFDIQIKELKLKPVKGKLALADKFKYNNAILNFNIDLIHFYHFDIAKLLKNQGVFIDSILVVNGAFDFYKDKRKPYDKKLIKKLPSELLKDLKTPIFIGNISFDACRILAENRYPKNAMQMKLSIDSIYGEIKNITNINDRVDIPMVLDIRSKLMGKGLLKVNLEFPLKNQGKEFSFRGTLGSSQFKYYDKVIYPVLGLKVLKGNLDYLSFKGKANNYDAYGTMRMLYHDLDATVYKKDSSEKSKFLSWAIKTVLHNSNPVKNKKVRVATMYHKHDKFRGFAGYLWKTLQSGIVNTLSPTGNKTSRKADKIMEKRKRKGKKKR